MTTQKYLFTDHPAAIVEDEDNRGLKFTRGVELDLYHEFNCHFNARWTPVGIRHLILIIDVPDEHTELLRCALHNLHQARPIS
jgi:hypothetical protein